ncbi:MAG: FKBP-type peptidyl-prolyl cis-trans isomerase [Salinivirgaceae bacterium]|jgi:FKBP-type peptidyl-prolyl cis-trans isomerase FkpA|nr:FKBP-type peptidyl-prolyl cis-trans isomerase [Salinivirgaceae bacterium]
MANRDKRERSRGSAGNNRKTGEDFLEKNRKKEGVKVNASGLQYLIVEEGDGDRPDDRATITVHQRCQLVNGTLIEDTYRENEASEVKMEELIEGYQEGIQLMKKGSRYKFFIPSELAWGKNGTGSKIPPNSVLIFDVKLIDFW